MESHTEGGDTRGEITDTLVCIRLLACPLKERHFKTEKQRVKAEPDDVEPRTWQREMTSQIFRTLRDKVVAPAFHLCHRKAMLPGNLPKVAGLAIARNGSWATPSLRFMPDSSPGLLDLFTCRTGMHQAILLHLNSIVAHQ